MSQPATYKTITHALSAIATWTETKLEFEQYGTQAELAAAAFLAARDACVVFEGKRVVDLGCGNGILGITAALCGAESVVFADIDEDSLELARKNAEMIIPDTPATFIHCDVSLPASCDLFPASVDLAVTNPPFGSVHGARGIDMRFVWEGLRLTGGAGVLSFHDAHTFDVKRQGRVETAKTVGLNPRLPDGGDASEYPLKARGTVLGTMDWEIASTYDFHRHSSKFIKVALMHTVGLN